MLDDIVVLWALGDADGPLDGEVKFGFCKRKAFDSQLKAMRAARSRDLAIRCAVYIRGECSALRLKSEVEGRLHELGCGLRKAGWFRAAGVIRGIVVERAAIEGVTLLTEADAVALARSVERRELEKIMERF